MSKSQERTLLVVVIRSVVGEEENGYWLAVLVATKAGNSFSHTTYNAFWTTCWQEYKSFLAQFQTIKCVLKHTQKVNHVDFWKNGKTVKLCEIDVKVHKKEFLGQKNDTKNQLKGETTEE